MNDLLLTQNLNWLWSSLTIHELFSQGVTHFYISPGMRNAPLIAAIENFRQKKQGFIFADTVMDERSASYRALGHAKKTGRPAVLVCTSGTALANYMPAIVEASKSRVPMIVLSADRPSELSLSDANQTIIQDHIYGNYVRDFLNMGPPTQEVSPRALRTSLSNIVAKCARSGLGGPCPVHINFPFREPLDGKQENGNLRPEVSKDYIQESLKTLNEKQKKASTYYTESYPQVPLKALEEVVESIRNSPKTLLVIGELQPWINQESISELINTLRTPIFLDVGSSLKYEHSIKNQNMNGPQEILPSPSFDHPEVFDQYKKNPPQLIIHLGGRLVSKHYYSLLDQSPEIKLITINDSPKKEDPSHQTSIRLVARPDVFSKELLGHIKEMGNSQQNKDLEENIFEFKGTDWTNFIKRKGEIIDDSPLSYPVISKTVIENIPNQSTLYLGNSTVIRSFDSYASENISKKINVITHRGASGIEGFISAACGHSETKLFESDKTTTTLVLGDVSAIHDLNAFVELSTKEIPLIIIIVNNFGGGIFTLLPMESKELLTKTMTSPHKIHFDHIAKAVGLHYTKVEDRMSFIEAYTHAQEVAAQGKPTVIEACFNHDSNSDVYKKLKTIRL